MGCSFGSNGILGNGESVIVRNKLLETEAGRWGSRFGGVKRVQVCSSQLCDEQVCVDRSGSWLNGGEAADVTRSRASYSDLVPTSTHARDLAAVEEAVFGSTGGM